MQEVGKRPSPARRIGRSLGLAVALTAAVVSIAACGSSGSSSSSSSSAPAASALEHGQLIELELGRLAEDRA